jgi:hypothetical protein
MQDSLITIVIMLFVLSLISERIATLIKLYLPSTRIKGKTEAEESVRERKIIWLSLLSGLITAAALKADLILILQKMNDKTVDATALLGWQGFQLKDLPRTFFGVIISAAFLSFGSKFWHDLIDILLEIKNAKKTINSMREQSGVAYNPNNPAANIPGVTHPNPITLLNPPQTLVKSTDGKHLPVVLNFATYPLSQEIQLAISGDPEGELSGSGQKFTYIPKNPSKLVRITATMISNPVVQQTFFIYS